MGIIPGPCEPHKNINSFLAPLVSELQEAWNPGFLIQLKESLICVKLALSCVACDIPATRKVCGFLSHNAELGCNKCLKKFKGGFSIPTDYSGYDREDYILRSQEQHRNDVNKTLQETTKTAQQKAESKYGVRYSVLLELAYFDPVKFVAIDAMHNLYLGSAKHCFGLWIEQDILNKDDIKTIENKISLFCLPANIGRLPSHISSCHGSFTADQWKNWITIYSPVVLKDTIVPNHLQCWLLFVQACSILGSGYVKQCDIDSADMLLHQFCHKFERLYGKSRCTMNMHLHMHLKEVFKNFGPPHSTWCFAFEHFNGILGSYHTNKQEIEVQIIKKFCQMQAVQSLDFPADEELSSCISHKYIDKSQSCFPSSLYLLQMAMDPLHTINSFTCKSGVSAIPPYYEHILTSEQSKWLKTIYRQLYNVHEELQISPFYQKCGRVKIACDLIGSDMPGANSNTSAVIMAFWPAKGHDLLNIDYSRMQVGIVQYFLIHHLSTTEVKKQKHIFAYVHWKKLHRNKDYFGISATVCENEFENNGSCCYIPIQRIACRCAFAVMSVKFPDMTETVFIACPVKFTYSL